MVRGVYSAASGMMAEQRRMDVVSNNLANVNTNGFKKDVAIFRAAPEERFHRVRDPQKLPWVHFTVNKNPYIGWSGSGVKPDEIFTTHQNGALKLTGNPLDLAVMGDAFFKVETPQGERYTRDGAFVLNEKSQISTVDGFLLMGENGPITIEGNSVMFAPNGEVLVDGEMVGKLNLVRFEKPSLELNKIGDNLFTTNPTGDAQEKKAESFRLMPGYLEGSNVNPVREMVDMITAMRAYETNQKMITSQDDTVGRAINTVGIVQ